MGSSFTKAIAPSAPAFTSPLVRDMARPGFPPAALVLVGSMVDPLKVYVFRRKWTHGCLEGVPEPLWGHALGPLRVNTSYETCSHILNTPPCIQVFSLITTIRQAVSTAREAQGPRRALLVGTKEVQPIMQVLDKVRID